MNEEKVKSKGKNKSECKSMDNQEGKNSGRGKSKNEA